MKKSFTTDSTALRKPGTAFALNKRASIRIGHVKTRPCTSRSRSVVDIRPLIRGRLSWPSLTTLRHLIVSGEKTGLSERLTKAVAPRLPLQQKSQSAGQWGQRPTATTTPGTSSKVYRVLHLSANYAMQVALEWATTNHPEHSSTICNKQSITTQDKSTPASSDPPPKITHQSSTGPDKPPIGTTTQRNLSQ